MHEIVDLDRYCLDRLDSADGQALVARCKADLAEQGMFNLDGLLNPCAITRTMAEVMSVIESAAFTHRRKHNIYFLKQIPGLDPGHPALRMCETVNHTICADQIPGGVLLKLYEWPPFAAFLATVMGKPHLHPMADPLARVNVMAYRDGEALNWHFDRSEFTTTLLLQAPASGGEFEYRTDLRNDADPNYDGVARLLDGADPDVELLRLSAGTLNVFRGKNTAHRVTPVEGGRERVIAVFSYFDRPGVVFSDDDRIGFYGRAS